MCRIRISSFIWYKQNFNMGKSLLIGTPTDSSSNYNRAVYHSLISTYACEWATVILFWSCYYGCTYARLGRFCHTCSYARGCCCVVCGYCGFVHGCCGFGRGCVCVWFCVCLLARECVCVRKPQQNPKQVTFASSNMPKSALYIQIRSLIYVLK